MSGSLPHAACIKACLAAVVDYAQRQLLVFGCLTRVCLGTAVLLAVVVLRGDMGARGVWDALTLDPSTSRLVPVRHQPLLLLQWLMRYHSQAVRHGASAHPLAAALHPARLQESIAQRIMPAVLSGGAGPPSGMQLCT